MDFKCFQWQTDTDTLNSNDNLCKRILTERTLKLEGPDFAPHLFDCLFFQGYKLRASLPDLTRKAEDLTCLPCASVFPSVGDNEDRHFRGPLWIGYKRARSGRGFPGWPPARRHLGSPFYKRERAQAHLYVTLVVSSLSPPGHFEHAPL